MQDDAVTPIVVGDFRAVQQVPKELSESRRLVDVPPPTIVFGGQRRHLEATRGQHVLGDIRVGDDAVLLGALGQDVGLIYLPAAGSPQLLHACPPLALTCFDVDRVVKDRACVAAATPGGGESSWSEAQAPRDASATTGAASASASATTSASSATASATTSAATTAAAKTTASDAPRGAASHEEERAVPVRTPAKVHLEHRRVVHGFVAKEIAPTLPEAIVDAFLALVDRAYLHVPEDGKKALGIEDVERVVAYLLRLCELGCRDLGGMTGKIHTELCTRIPEFDVPRYAFARVLELLFKVGTCILVKLSKRKWRLRFVGLNDPTSEHHQRFVAETETKCRFPLPPGTKPPTPRRKSRPATRERGELGNAGRKTGADAGGRSATRAPRGERAKTGSDEPVLRDTSRSTTTGERRVGDDHAAAPEACGQQLELPFDGAGAEFGDADLRRGVEVGNVDLRCRRGDDGDASELRAALDELATLLVGPGREGAGPRGAGDVGLEPDQPNDTEANGGQDAGAAHEQVREAAADLDDVVRRLLGIGGAAPVPHAVSSPDESRLDERSGPQAGDAADLSHGSTEAGGEQAPAGRAPEPEWACEGTNLRVLPCCGDDGNTGRISDLGQQMTSCGNKALESLVVAVHVGDRGDLWRDPIPPLVDFRVLLEVNARQGAENSLNAARRSCWAGAYPAAPRRTAPSSSMSEPDCPGAVVGAERPSGRCLSLLGPRGPPQERAPQAPRCDREDGRDRKAEADRRRACEAAPGRRGPNTPTTLSSGPSDPHSSCPRPWPRVGSMVSSPRWSSLVDPLHVEDVNAAFAGGLSPAHRRPDSRLTVSAT